MNKGKLKMLIGACILAVVAIGCSNKVSQLSPEQVIDNALAEADGFESFYAESEITIADGSEEVEKMMIKEWRDGSRVRVEIEGADGKAISTYDGIQFTVYDETSNTVIIDDDESFEFPQMSMKEQAEMLLDLISESHETEVVGEEKIIGRDTFHLKAIQQNEAALFGDQELWIDKDNWLILKIVSVSGDMVTTAEYKKVDFETDMTDDLFTIDLPDDVEFVDTSDFDMEVVSEVTDGIEKIGQPFLYIPETDDLTIDEIEFTDLGEQHKELNITYSQSGEPYFDLAIIDSTIGDDDELFDIDAGGKTVDIRGEEGVYFEMEDFRIVSWSEESLNYSVHLIDSALQIEDVQKLLNKMEEVE